MNLRRWGLVAAAVLLLGTGCANSPEGHLTPGAATKTPLTPQQQKLAATWDEFREVVAAEAVVDLAAIPRPKPEGTYTQADVDALADQAERLLFRSVDPKLSAMDPDEGYSYVMRGQPAWTFAHLRGWLIDSNTGTPWQDSVASRFDPDAEVSDTEMIGARWDSGLRQAKDADTPYLWVALEGIFRTNLTKGGQTYPVVVMRTVVLSSYDPLNKGWAPGVDFYMYPYGNDGCHPADAPEFVALGDPKALREDLDDLKKLLASDEIWYPRSHAMSAKQLKDWRAACAKRPPAI